MEESSGTKPEELEQVPHTVPNGRCATPVQMENAMAEDVQSAETKVEVYISVGAKIVPSTEDSIKLLPFGELPQDTKLGSLSPVKVQDENLSGILSSLKQVTPNHNHELGSDMVVNEAKENHVIATENTDNGPIKDQNSEIEHISMEQEGTLPEKVTQHSCLESSTSNVDTQSRIYSGDQLGSPTDNASKKFGLEELGPGQETATEDPSHSEDAVKGTPVLPRNGQISLASLEGSVKVLTEERKKNKKNLVNSSRSLRSRSQEKSKAPDTTNIVTEESADREKKRKKKKKRMEKNKVDEFSRIRTHLRYLLQRIKYEKSFIDAYSGEGWKGQSIEKLKPEKELQRAKSEILRRKLKIRDLFQRLDSLCTEGRIPETLFDSEGEIDSEDIFCAKCASKNVTLSNDIILCDGACERGFHQFCLDPPLLKEHIPPDDEGWLCPGCDCKVDCLELLNDSQGTNISVSDSWEKVFAEEAAAAAAGKNLDDLSGLPSDDSEDDDYNPDDPKLNEKVQVGVSSSDDSDNHSASDDQRVLPQKEMFLGLPSDDSEDDDYDPDGLNIDQKSKMETSSSDFTSDSEDFTVVSDKYKPSGEVQGPVTSSPDRVRSDEEDRHPEEGDPASIYPRRQLKRLDYKKLHDEEYGNTSSDSSDDDYMHLASPNTKMNNSDEEDSLSPNLEHLTAEHGKETSDPEEGDPASIYPRRQVKRLDYKKLHDEEYGNTSSDSSDEDYGDLASSDTEKNISDEKDSFSPNLENLTKEHEKETGDLELDQKTRETTQIKGRLKKNDVDGTISTSAKSLGSSSATRGKGSSRLKKKSGVNGTKSTPARLQKDSSASSGKSTYRSSFGEHATQRLLQSFKENQYPPRAVKESLATESGLSVQQVSKWFENARHSFRHSPHKISDGAKVAPDKGTPRQKSMNLSESNSKSVLDNASEVKKKKQDKEMAAVTECFDKDIASKMLAEEGSRQNSRITKTRKRKAEFGSEAPEPNTSVETPKKKAKTQGVRKSSRIQSKSKEST